MDANAQTEHQEKPLDINARPFLQQKLTFDILVALYKRAHQYEDMGTFTSLNSLLFFHCVEQMQPFHAHLRKQPVHLVVHQSR